MTIEKLLRRILTTSIIISVTTFTLSYIISLFGYKPLGNLTSLFATLTLALTPLVVVLAIAVEMAKKRDFNGLFMSIIIIIVMAISVVSIVMVSLK